MCKVFVIDSEGQTCLPTKPRRAKQLLKQGRAIVKQVVPFTIQLKRKVENPVGSFEFGVDDGAKHVGLAIKNTKTEEIVFHGRLDHRQDVSLKMTKRRDYRRARRQRLRYRAPRFNNRTRSKIAPSIRQRKEAIVRVIKDLSRKLNLTKVIVEEVFFNHAEHIWGKFFSLTEVGKTYLKKEIQNLGLEYETTFGYVTEENRLRLGLSKRHSYDACAILNSNKIVGVEYFVKPRRTKRSLMKKCDEKNGFRHYDLIKANHRTRGVVIGSISGFRERNMTVRTKWGDNNFGVSYKKSILLQRFGGLIYSF